ncbi:glycosyltransferase family 4 protein [Desulfobacula phenolica]|nr:glycosyltransferase family 4 protein [Desulfobacula phenolica]
MNKRKTICIVSPYPPPLGGMAIQAQKMGRLLKESGYDVVAVKTNADIPPPLAFLSRFKGIRTIATVLFFLKNLNSALNRTSVVYFFTGFFDFFFWVTYPALILIKLRKKRVILSVRGGGAREFFKKYKKLLAPVFYQVDTFTAPSGFLKDVFKEFFDIDPVLVPNIADLDQFQYMDRKVIQPKFIVTRSLEDIYNVECVIQAFNLIHDEYPDAGLGIVGDGTRRRDLERLVTKLDLKDCVTFYGRVEHSKIQNYYKKYDVFINASKVDNLPGTILESFACGLPVVTTSPGGIPYMVKDGKTGILVKDDDCQALADKTIELLQFPEKANALAKNARKEIYSYSWEKIKPVLFELL